MDTITKALQDYTQDEIALILTRFEKRIDAIDDIFPSVVNAYHWLELMRERAFISRVIRTIKNI